MRCKNCGWENPASSVKCEKCGAPLSGDVASDAGNGAFQRTERENPLRGTISEGDVFGNDAVAGGSTAGSVCKACGYPIGRNTSVCPNCGAPVVVAGGQGGYEGANYNEESEAHHCGASPSGEQSPRVENARANNKCEGAALHGNATPQKGGAHSVNGTINPWSAPEQGAFCTLKPVSWEGENVDHQAISYSGETIVLNRANTDPNNQSITTKGQAELSFEDGAWYIRDKSAQKTTYVHASRKTKLESGDIIILGNRQFEFKA